VSIPSSFGQRLIGALGTGPAEIGDEQRYLQQRVRLFLRTILTIVCTFYGFELVMILIGAPGQLLRILARPDRVMHVLVGLVIGAGFLWVRRSERPAWALHAIEGVGTVGLIWLMVAMVATFPRSLSPEMMAMLPFSFILVLRAAIVPSRAGRTAVIGAISLAPLAVLGVMLRRTEGADLPYEWGIILRYRVPVWGVVAVGISAVVSHVVHGLQATVRDAMEIGQYRLERKLGEGAMGIVYQATHRMLRRPTAVKLLHPDRAGAAAVARFEREVVHTSRLAHPSTVAIWDYGRTRDGIFYYAMELLDGLTLEQLVAETGPLPPGRVAHVMARVAESLAEAHAAGLVHRDVKPANVMVCDRGGVADTVKVLDFGLVKELAGASESGLTHEGSLVGTPLYLSPEAVTRPEAVDGRADIYALGATGYFLLTGGPVFAGATLVEVLSHHLHSPPKRPSERLGHDVPPELEEMLLSCLQKDPADRPADAGSIAERLSRVALELGWTARTAREWWSGRARKVE